MFLQKLCSIMTFLYWATSLFCWYPKGACLMRFNCIYQRSLCWMSTKDEMWKKTIQTINSIIARHIDIENCKMVCLLSNTRLILSINAIDMTKLQISCPPPQVLCHISRVPHNVYCNFSENDVDGEYMNKSCRLWLSKQAPQSFYRI